MRALDLLSKKIHPLINKKNSPPPPSLLLFVVVCFLYVVVYYISRKKLYINVYYIWDASPAVLQAYIIS